MCLFLVPEPVRNRFSYFFLIFPLKFVIPIGFLVNPVVWARNLGQYSPVLSESQLRSSKKLHNKIKDGIINAVVSGLPNLTN